MSTEIYYFSGTGNSLHVAKELQKRIPETTLIPMARLLNQDVIETNGETIGFVFPIHLMTIPWNVKSVIEKLDVTSGKYFFVAVTRIGSPCRTAFTKIEKILKKKGKSLDSYLILNMASNDPKFKNWHQATAEEIANFESEIQNRLNLFQNMIMNKIKFREKDTQITVPVNSVMEYLGAFMAEISGDGGTDFYADAKCTGCGICEKVCLSQKIKMFGKKPIWQKNGKCFLCYACLNFCPVQSVQMKSGRFFKFYTDKNGRYFHPEATADEIAGQK